MIRILNTLTHDKYDPHLYGFCFSVMHDLESGDIIFQHNGLENITSKDLDRMGDLVKEIYPLVLESKLKEKERREKEIADGLKQAVREINAQAKLILDNWSKEQ